MIAPLTAPMTAPTTALNETINAVQTLISKVHWKARQKYSQARCHLGGGHYVWALDEQTRFVACQGDAFSHVLYVCGGHEKTEMRWCRRWLEAGAAGQTVIDCGANIGYFSAVLSQTVPLDSIVAIEGNPKTAQRCRQNLALLQIANVQLIEAILSEDAAQRYVIPDQPGAEPWQRAVKAGAAGDIPEDMAGDTTAGTAIDTAAGATPTLTLDQLVLERQLAPSLIKIDCEGFETLILKGATQVLGQVRPALMIECNDGALRAAGTSRHELLALLRSHHYRLFHLASFIGFYPLGIEIEDDFPSSEFNFAAIPDDPVNGDRWLRSIQPWAES